MLLLQTVPTVLHNLYSLATNPEVQEKVYEEIQTVVGMSDEITSAHLSQLNYLKAVVKETFRCAFKIPKCLCKEIGSVVRFVWVNTLLTIIKHKHNLLKQYNYITVTKFIIVGYVYKIILLSFV